tara:strand:- start:3371 stop:3556 length:186 start_codon:yes stop_codon:yes gene_type:complete
MKTSKTFTIIIRSLNLSTNEFEDISVETLGATASHAVKQAKKKHFAKGNHSTLINAVVGVS